MNTLHRLFSLAALLPALGSPLHSVAGGNEFYHSWLGSVAAPCEGFGIAGAYRAHVAGMAEKKKDGSWVVTLLRVHATSAAFTQNEGSASAFAVVKVGSKEKAKLTLMRPTPPSIEAATKPEETRRVYLPKDKAVTVPPNGQLRVNVSAVAKTSQGLRGSARSALQRMRFRCDSLDGTPRRTGRL